MIVSDSSGIIGCEGIVGVKAEGRGTEDSDDSYEGIRRVRSINMNEL